METLDRYLGGVEILLVLASVPALAAVIAFPSRRRLVLSSLGVAIIGITLAQPFGLVARDQGASLPPAGARPVGATSVHATHFGPLPIRFRLYHRTSILRWFNTPDATLRARSWMPPGLLTNSARVAQLCAPDGPCWAPHDNPKGLIHGELPGDYADTLLLFKQGPTYWAVITRPHPDGASRPATKDIAGSWKLTSGLASPLGLAYWILASAALLAGYWRLRRRDAEAKSVGTSDARAATLPRRCTQSSPASRSSSP